MYETVQRILDGFVNCLVPEIGEEVVTSSLGITNGRMPLLRQMEKLWALGLDTVVEIGTREGIMTALLSRFARQVICYEASCQVEIVRESWESRISLLFVCQRHTG